MICCKSGMPISRGNSHDFCEVVTRMLYGNVLQIDKIYQPLPEELASSLSECEISSCEHSLMVEHYYVIIGGVGSSPTVLDYFRFKL